jgi:hypothetical protein
VIAITQKIIKYPKAFCSNKNEKKESCLPALSTSINQHKAFKMIEMKV